MIISVYNAKGGVGKTTLAVNLSWASAKLSARRTLLWDLDAQGGASYILRQEPAGRELRKRIVENDEVGKLVRESPYERLHVLPADESIRHLDRHFHELGKRGRLARVGSALASEYERVIIDCPPGLTTTSEQILGASDLVLVPLIPAALSQRALDAVKHYLAGNKAPKVVLAPVFVMVDRRRHSHVRELEEHPGWPVVPMASAYERVSDERAPVGELLPLASPPVAAIALLWRRIESALGSAR
ncbi:MAG TPA: ParA family protein [Sphingomicrobium sp.]|nr:ParA family protein [Sphingomicrobium sp.]